MPAPEETRVSLPASPGPLPARRELLRVRRRPLAVLLAVVTVAVAIVVLLMTGVFASGGSSTGGLVDNPYPTAVARVTRQSLSQQTQVSATLTYAGSATIVAPSGTSPPDLLQAQQQVTSDEGMLDAANATLTSDSGSLAQLEADLAAARAKEAVDCAGANAAQTASGSSTGADSGTSGCSSDVQNVTTDEQSLTQDTTKVASDRTQVSSAAGSLAGAETALAAAGTSASLYGQDSTYTTLPALGQIVKRGQSLYAVSGSPVFLLYGQTAAWRAFVSGMSPGPDVAELNANLDALGYGKGLAGDTFTPASATAIEAFQTARGVPPSGQLLLGAVVFQPGAVRVTSVTPTLGATVQPGPVLTVTLTTRQVQIQLDAALQSEVKLGDAVTITLPDNENTPGVVSYVGTVATTPSNNGGGGGSSSPTINVYVTPTEPAATGSLDQAPVNVSITTASVSNVLVVPVDALLALASGGYAVEEIDTGGIHQLVGVTLGLFDDANGDVQVSGPGLAAGQRVVVPNL